MHFFSVKKPFMSNEYILTTLLVIAIVAVVMYGIAYQTGRMHGYSAGLDQGTQLSSRVEHLKGMSDGYVLALQHTSIQRTEYLNNVLLRTGAVTAADIEAERQRRFQLQSAA